MKLCTSIDDIHKLWLKWCTTNKKAVNVWFLGKFFGIGTFNRSSINNPNACSHCSRYIFRYPLAQLLVHFLCLFRGGRLSSANSPHWLIGNNNLTPVLNLVCNSFHLLGAYCHGLVCLSFFQFLSNARDDTETIIQSKFGLICNQLITFS